MPKTPSFGLDQNGSDAFRDRYWGRVPKFIHRIPEQNICEVNEDYLTLLKMEIDGDLDHKNISKELLREITLFIDQMCNKCTMTGEDKALARALDGDEPCPTSREVLGCDELLCCNEVLSCSEPIICAVTP